ncbi:lasso peptide biosynthesis B2 protein [Shewanella dokdonensis]|uniref:Lasso peptide biosynthesis B2 protein n=1 Tax=Shewanella dokdonensis TaxID=712036 RepID=A0ABX8DI53_9GAMM|nr:lasso peptide biosynthesis B2 protein [Shewanella dokdonensis]MCL1073821.1 lasso peptide biosynthesis B2 protein [Shewanella dokdonensis]QVK23607.1 lasso peptide biosynthesis B2 protein [Shewanella dokdonensis]
MTSAWIKFLRQSLFIQCWAIPTWLLLGLSKLAIFRLSFRKLAPRLGILQAKGYWIPLISEKQRLRAKQISKLVQGIAPYTPWESNCFPQAITARFLLGLYGIPGALYFGLCRDAGQIKAHAWVCSGSVRVTGGYSFNQFTVVGAYLFTLKMS